MIARLPLAVALAVATAAFGRASGSLLGLGLAVLAALTALGSRPIDPSLERLARLLGRVAVVATVLVGWALTVAPMLHGERTDDVMRTIGFFLVGCALPLAVHRPRAEVAVLLHAVALLGLAGLYRRVEIRPHVAVAGLALCLHLIASARVSAVGRARPSLGRAALSVLLLVGLATPVAAGLPPLQRRIEQAVSGRRTWELRGRTGLSAEDVRVGEILSLAASDRAVLRLYGPRAQRLRAQVFTRFDGRLWHAVHATPPTSPPPVTAPVGPSAAPMLVRFDGPLRLFPGVLPEDLGSDQVVASRLEPVELDEGLIVQPGDALAVATEDDVRVDAAGLLVRNDRRQPDPYVVLHRRRSGVGDPRAPSDADRALALGLPRALDPRVVAVAARLSRADGAGEGAPLLPVKERIRRTIAYLRDGAQYSMTTPKYAGRDVVADFLFVHHVGYCEHFASALAVLLRLQGIPTRYVTGFNVSEDDREGEHYVVRDRNAHAWVEAFVEGEGWLEVDATPTLEGDPRPRGGLLRRLRAFFADLRAAVRYGAALDVLRRLRWPLAGLLSLIGLAYVARNEVRRRRALGSPPTVRAKEPLPEALAGCVGDLELTWTRLGVPRPSSVGLLEHAQATADRVPVRAQEAIVAAVQLVHDAVFGGEAPDPTRLAAARADLRGAHARGVT